MVPETLPERGSEALITKQAFSTAKLADLLAGTRAVGAYPDGYLGGLVEPMSEANFAHIPVISREDGRVIGYIGWKHLMSDRFCLQAEERERVVLYRVH